VDAVKLMQDVALGGAFGLQTLSLAECKNVTDLGISHLIDLKYL
jgi:hypothetical protein